MKDEYNEYIEIVVDWPQYISVNRCVDSELLRIAVIEYLNFSLNERLDAFVANGKDLNVFHDLAYDQIYDVVFDFITDNEIDLPETTYSKQYHTPMGDVQLTEDDILGYKVMEVIEQLASFVNTLDELLLSRYGEQLLQFVQNDWIIYSINIKSAHSVVIEFIRRV
jgi:hypothetical protein